MHPKTNEMDDPAKGEVSQDPSQQGWTPSSSIPVQIPHNPSNHGQDDVGMPSLRSIKSMVYGSSYADSILSAGSAADGGEQPYGTVEYQDDTVPYFGEGDDDEEQDNRHARAVPQPVGSQVYARVLMADEAGSSSMASVFTLCNSAIGAGVLSLPFAFRCAGAITCVFLCIFVAAAEGFTLYVLSKFAERYNAHTYGKLVHRALGRRLSAALSMVLYFYLWGACVAYMVIIGDTFTSLIQLLPHGDQIPRTAIMAFLSTFAILPMCLPKKLGELTWVSISAVVGFVYTALIVVYKGLQAGYDREPPFSGVKMFKLDINALQAIPIIVFGFNCHGNVVAVMTELHHSPSMLQPGLPASPRSYRALSISVAPRPRTKKLVGMLGVIITALQIISAGYLAVGFTGYMAYPTTVKGNILESFPEHDLLIQIARGVIGAVVVGHYPINHHPARSCAEDLLHFVTRGRKSEMPFWMSLSQTLFFVYSTLLVAVQVQDLEVVLTYVGGTAASFMIFFLPGLLLVNAGMMKFSAAELEAQSQHPDSPMSAVSRRTTSSLAVPLLKKAAARGIKGTKSILFTPTKSWWSGVFLMGLSIAIAVLTLSTAFFPRVE